MNEQNQNQLGGPNRLMLYILVASVVYINAQMIGTTFRPFDPLINYYYSRTASRKTDEPKELEKKVAEYGWEYGRTLSKYNPATGRQQLLPDDRRMAVIDYFVRGDNTLQLDGKDSEGSEYRRVRIVTERQFNGKPTTLSHNYFLFSGIKNKILRKKYF